jgi:hypothetical protein
MLLCFTATQRKVLMAADIFRVERSIPCHTALVQYRTRYF